MLILFHAFDLSAFICVHLRLTAFCRMNDGKNAVNPIVPGLHGVFSWDGVQVPEAYSIGFAGTWGRCQISSLYSCMVRSVEKRPLVAVLQMLMRVHRSSSLKAAAACFWAST